MTLYADMAGAVPEVAKVQQGLMELRYVSYEITGPTACSVPETGAAVAAYNAGNGLEGNARRRQPDGGRPRRID